MPLAVRPPAPPGAGRDGARERARRRRRRRKAAGAPGWRWRCAPTGRCDGTQGSGGPNPGRSARAADGPGPPDRRSAPRIGARAGRRTEAALASAASADRQPDDSGPARRGRRRTAGPRRTAAKSTTCRCPPDRGACGRCGRQAGPRAPGPGSGNSTASCRRSGSRPARAPAALGHRSRPGPAPGPSTGLRPRPGNDRCRRPATGRRWPARGPGARPRRTPLDGWPGSARPGCCPIGACRR